MIGRGVVEVHCYENNENNCQTRCRYPSWMCTLFASFSLHEYIDVSKTNVMMLILLWNVTLLMLLCPYRII